MTDFNNIPHNADEDLNPELNRSGNKNPFGTGGDYFENFAEKLKGRIDQYEEIQAEAPILSNIPKYNPFEVPANYFDELPTIIQQKCISNNKTSVWEWIAMIFRPNFAIPVLTICLIAFAGIHFLNTKTTVSNDIAQEISVDEQLQNIDESTLIDAIATSENSSENEYAGENDNENIKNYLLDNNIDESNLDNEL